MKWTFFKGKWRDEKKCDDRAQIDAILNSLFFVFLNKETKENVEREGNGKGKGKGKHKSFFFGLQTEMALKEYEFAIRISVK